MATWRGLSGSLVNQEERRLATEQRQIFRHGTAAQRRRVLKMRNLPLPDDIDAVAAPGVAVIDLPAGTTSLQTAGQRQSDIFDPLQPLAERYGVDHTNDDGDDGNSSVDYASFLEVLCPNGTSLLERLPLTPTTSLAPSPRAPQQQQQPREQQQLDVSRQDKNAQSHFTRSPSSSPHNSCATQSPLPVPSSLNASAATAAATDNVLPSPNKATHDPSFQNTELQHTTDAIYVDVPISFIHPTTAPNDAADANAKDKNKSACDAESIPTIFVSVGFISISPPRSARHRHRHCQASRHLSPASPLPSCVSAEYLSSNGRSGLTSPTEDITPLTSTPRSSAPHTPLTTPATCALGGRVLLTDRLVEAQARTALPTMLEAYRQYVHAAANNLSPPSSSSSSEYHHKRWSKLSRKEEEAATLQALAPRQHGVVLKMRNTTEEVLKCVAEASCCTRPSFRYIDSEDLYGSGSYSSNAFMKKR